MRDERLDRLADVLLEHSLRLEAGDVVQVRAAVESKPLVKALFRRASELGLFLLVQWLDEEISRLNYELLSAKKDKAENFLKLTNKWELQRSEDIKAYLTIRAEVNDQELNGISAGILQMAGAASREVSDRIINERQWALFYWPTRGQAQRAGMPFDKWFDHAMAVSIIDYKKLHQAELKLAALIEQTNSVRIVAPETELTFSVKGMPAVCCYGRRNVPDGEVYTAPVIDSVEGQITYNVPSNQWGHTFEKIKLKFEKGKIIECNCSSNSDLLNDIFNSDEGARYIGEFSFGVNPRLTEPMGSTLFDEKITGSIHFTPGRAYAKADNGNRSSLHWDLIQIQRPEYGGGEIYFDGKLIRKDGLFVLPELQELNPGGFD